MKTRWDSALVIAIASAVVAAGADDQQTAGLRRFEFREAHMGTEFSILLYGADEDHANRAAALAFERIAALDVTLSDYRAESELSGLGRRAGGPDVPVSADLFEVLRRSRALSERTEGAFDVTIGPVVKLWRRARRRGELPDPALLRMARDRVGWEHLELDPERRTARLERPGMALDVGGIAKGYASDAALEVLRAEGFDRALVAGAGDIAASGPPPGSVGWVVGIAPLDPDRAPGRILLLRDRAVSTSGDAERFVEIDGVRYSHIVDPRTGLGLTGRSSVTVTAPDASTSDSLATAVSVLGPAEGLALVARTSGAEALIVAANDGGPDLLEWLSDGFERPIGPSPEPPTEAIRTLGGAAP